MATTTANTTSSNELDIYKYLIGTWKRCLEFRQFGGLFQHLSTSNTVVQIDEVNRIQQQDVDTNIRYMKWSFGKSKSDLRFGYEMRVKPQQQLFLSSSSSSLDPNSSSYGSIFSSPLQLMNNPNAADQVQKQTLFEWQISGTTCQGYFYHESKVAVFNFILRNSIVTVTYRVMDENTMAVCIAEIDDKQQPTIQYGNMYRLV
jgi:hypothetical protein